jgi:hypothetical protein
LGGFGQDEKWQATLLDAADCFAALNAMKHMKV